MTKVNLPWLDANDVNAPFPSPEDALDYPEGLVAAGGDLNPIRLIRAYKEGIFPWYEQGQPILWWSPNPRGLFFPRNFILHRSLKRSLRKHQWHVTYNQAFRDVMIACAEPRAYSKNTWITKEMTNAYCKLHQLNYAHSVEVWNENNALIGGIYGLSLGSIFFGESMFSRVTNGSKVALLYLCAYLDKWDYKIMDTQLPSAHLASLGGTEISRSEYLKILANVLDRDIAGDAWEKQQTIDIDGWIEELA